MRSADNIIHPAWVRISHWINAVAVIVLVLSGWRIYNASPIFEFSFPDRLTLGGWLGGALLWHFAAMWALLVNGIIYLAMNLASGRFAFRFLPIRPRDLLHDVAAALKGRLAHESLREYNAVQKFAYVIAIVDTVLIVVSGLVIWKSVQFPLLRTLLGGYDNARVVHFVAMAAMVAFVVVHVAMVALVPRTLLLMTRGR